ncbi:hypothetical protein Taro_000839 [Colocasia esculenta]|uniref:Bax inhibitor 1 n=1 Tax=Colocasia esculenta TaxID=4460 RepID=A0A843TD28_COLES|nr:hypothetical protein [Colocasia esculenta]
MDYFQREAFGASRWSYDSLKNFAPLNARVQNHLKKVYLTLCLAVAASAAGAYLHLLLNIGGVLTTLGCVLSIAWLLATPPYEERKRFGILMASSLLQGATIGPLKGVLNMFFLPRPNHRILLTAFVGTALAFGCFSAAAVVARRRQYLFLGGLLSSGLSILLWLQFASSIFGASTAAFNVEIYFGLLIFLGYMVFDTQLIIERAYHGELDHVRDALNLYVDLVGVFVRVLVVMVKNAAEKEERKRKKRSS